MFTDLRDNTKAFGQAVDNPPGRTARDIIEEHVVGCGCAVEWDVPGTWHAHHPWCLVERGLEGVAGEGLSVPFAHVWKHQRPVDPRVADIEAAGLYKRERVITSCPRRRNHLGRRKPCPEFCAQFRVWFHPRVVEAAKKAIDTHGFGMSSVRFICGTQDIHKELEQRIADFHHTEDTILYAAFDATAGCSSPC